MSLYLLSSSGKKTTEIINNNYYEKGEHKLVWEYNKADHFLNGFYIIVLEINNQIVYTEKLINK